MSSTLEDRYAAAERLAARRQFAQAESEMRTVMALTGQFSELTASHMGMPWTDLDPMVRCSHCQHEEAEAVAVVNASRNQRCYGLIDPVKVWVRCIQCGLVRTERPPPTQRLADYYQRVSAPGGDMVPPGAQALFRMSLHADELVDRIERRLPTGRLLEVGSSWGAFCSVAHYRGYEVLGLEASHLAVEWSRAALGVNALRGFAPDDLPTGPFEIIAMWEVIEHFVDPGRVLQEVGSPPHP